MRGKTWKRRPDHNDDDDVSLEEDDDWAFPNCSESTANGMFSWSGLHLDSWTGGCVLYIMALKTAETVGMYSVLFLASSHVRPISWQSLSNILLALSSLVLLSCVSFLAFNCNNNHIQGCFSHKKTVFKLEYQGGKVMDVQRNPSEEPNCLQCKMVT